MIRLLWLDYYSFTWNFTTSLYHVCSHLYLDLFFYSYGLDRPSITWELSSFVLFCYEIHALKENMSPALVKRPANLDSEESGLC